MRARAVAAGLLGTAVAVALLATAVERAGGVRFVAPLLRVPAGAIALAVVCEASVQVGKALKWTGLLAGLRPECPPRLRSALAGVLVGGMATQLIPLRLDEVLRAKVLADREGLPAAAVLGTVALDRAVEIAVLGALLGTVAVFGALPAALVLGVRVVAGAGALVIVGGAAALALDRRAGSLPRWAARARPRLADLAKGLRSIPRGAALARVGVGTAIEWSATCVLYAVLLGAVGLHGPASLPLGLALAGAAAYGVPNVPGALGTFEAAVAGLAEAVAGAPPAEALAFALVAHAVLTVPITGAGLAVVAATALRRARPTG